MLGQTMDGGLGDDQIQGGPGDDILYGDAGNDTLRGDTGNDTYYFGRDDGQDVVNQQGSTPADLDTLQFAADVAADQLWFSRAGSDLQISIIGTADTTIVAGWYLGDEQHVDRIQTADGQVLLESRVQQLVEAMASFAPPPMGQTTLGDPYQPLMPVIAATWAT
jgi:Ca2+-binding RTX toxin-like protein